LVDNSDGESMISPHWFVLVHATFVHGRAVGGVCKALSIEHLWREDHMTNDLSRGRRAMITGASSGLGPDFVCDLAAHGCHLALIPRRAATAIAHGLRAKQ